MTQSIILPIPDDLYNRARQISDETSQSIEDILLQWMEDGGSDEDTLPLDEQAELDAIAHLSDDLVWLIAKEQMSLKLQERMQVLMDKSDSRAISDLEHNELAALVELGDRLMLRKAQAAIVLRERGHQVTQKDLNSNE